MKAELICPPHDVLLYLEVLEARLRTVLIQLGGTHAWAPLRRVIVDLQQEIANGWADLDRSCAEMEALDELQPMSDNAGA
jgi:hypothetical protein